MRVRLGGLLLAALSGAITHAGCAAVDGLGGLVFDLPSDAGDEDAEGADGGAGDGGAGDADACVLQGHHCAPS